MAYNTPETVADYLARFQMEITHRGKGTFTPDHVKYSLTDAGERLWGQLDYEDYLPLEGLTAMGKHYELGDENQFIHDLYNSPELCAAPVTWNSPSDALLRNTRKRKGRSLTTSPPANGVCILSTPESVTVSMVA